MKKCLLVLVALGFFAVLGQFSTAYSQGTQGANQPTDKPAGYVIETMNATATVKAINSAKREITLTLDNGKTKKFKLGPEVRNFDQIKVGDKVNITFAEALGVFVRKSDAPPSAEETDTVGLAPKGAKPGVLMANTTVFTAKVEAINYKKRKVTLKGPNGTLKTVKVAQEVKRFDEVKKGDDVTIRVTDALLIDVMAPQK